MIRISQIKIDIDRIIGKDEYQVVLEATAKTLRMEKSKIHKMEIMKRSIDARKKPEIKYIYQVDVSIDNEDKFLKRVAKNNNIAAAKRKKYNFRPVGSETLTNRPVVVGSGPAGLFAAYMLSLNGYNPILLERGADVDTRVEDVNSFWETNKLNPESNVQFGEGGAGTFSDGKLNTVVKDELGRNRFIYETFVEHGAPEDILYNNKPHIGTDRLRDVVKGMRQEIIDFGGEVRFHNKVTDLKIENGKVVGVEVNGSEIIETELVVLAIGHSARDTFEMLYKNKIPMEKKNFAIGARIEHPQSIINQSQYGSAADKLPAADYKLTYHAENDRGVYSFCMCPGGFVVNSSSEEGLLVVNGMSNYDRGEKNADSAIIVQVTAEDFDDESPLAGMNFQRKWEAAAYKAGNGLVPVQRFEDFCNNKVSAGFGTVTPNIKGQYTMGNIRECLPDYVAESMMEGIKYFDQKIAGFGNPDALLVGVETRTSSPVRINRDDENRESTVKGLFPCGEGAGYAGGITSAAIDGIKVYEAIAKNFKPFI
ncbi:MAG: FAD-dependent oxidoreductase [bacterium]|nr:FAD-dependent oxidoreductase [bacterium]